MDVTVDGELTTQTPIHVSIVPNAVVVAAPREA
jgi:diacylglycerol kinase family enzyme